MLSRSIATVFIALIFSLTIVTGTPTSKKAKGNKNASFPISVKFHAPRGNITHNDQLRASQLASLGSLPGRKKASLDAQNPGNNVEVYGGGLISSIDVGVGDPPTTYNLIVDTGSSITFVGADKSYVRTSTSDATVNVGYSLYGSGILLFRQFYDTLSLSKSLAVQNQSIGVTTPLTAQGFTGYDGILGLGPVDLTEGTVIGAGSISTVPDNLSDQGSISTEVIGISYTPAQSSSQSGELTFGGTDDSKYIETITYVPITSSSPSSSYWGIDLDATYGGGANGTIFKSASGIVDTGTTLILLASDAFSAYQTATGGEMDQNTGLLMITKDQYRNLKSLYFQVGGETFELTRNAQIWPRKMNSVINGQSNAIYLVVSDLGSTIESGLDFILGYAFLQRFYSVFDTTNSRVGLAKTSHTYDTSN